MTYAEKRAVPVAVWAPSASRVEVETGTRRIRMQEAEGGWWTLAGGLPPDTDYAFRLDGEDARPDPRSRWQPAGVHGPSRTVDFASFPWTDEGWQTPPLESAVIYEVHVGTFSSPGTFAGVADRLDHLAGLGVTHVQLMPVNGFPGRRGWGYDGVNLFAVHDAYGGPAGLSALVDACHARGLAVLLDVVYNHLGPEGNYLARFGPYFTKRYATPWGKAVNLDGPDCDEVRRFICDNALQWLRDYHVDGLRIDAVHAIVDTSARHVLEQLADETRGLARDLGRNFVLIAESDLNDPRVVRPRGAGGYGLDAQWSDDLHHALHAVMTGEDTGYYSSFGRVGDVAKALRDAFVYDGRYSPYRRRTYGRPVGDLPGSCFLGYLQTHDQVGNRALGERLTQLVPFERVLTAAALVLTSPCVPMLFQGEEWGASSPFLYFTDHGDPELGRRVKEGRRDEFASFAWKHDIPDPQALSTFERSRLRWDERGRKPHRTIEAAYRRLVELRHDTPELRNPDRSTVHVTFDEPARWIRVERGSFTVTGNFGPEPAEVPLPGDSERRLLWSSGDGVEVASTRIVLPPDRGAILG